MRKTKILPWTEEWAQLYKKEERILKDIFKDELVEIYHIGSTSVPAIGYAKPIIDILIAVKNIEKVNDYNGQMIASGYEPKGENGIAGRRFFSKGQDQRTHHVHIFQVDSEQIKIHLDFKEYLLNNPEEAKKYGELKICLAKQFPNEHYKYQEGKQQFVNNLVIKAKEWALRNKITNEGNQV
ncbi:MAG TPA: GrpB family protein [Bacillus sp. (in: firmicutes)]|nr:GrpB family protein [Bacillus sp. (in: firmicutes)]